MTAILVKGSKPSGEKNPKQQQQKTLWFPQPQGLYIGNMFTIGTGASEKKLVLNIKNGRQRTTDPVWPVKARLETAAQQTWWKIINQ